MAPFYILRTNALRGMIHPPPSLLIILEDAVFKFTDN
jgi:hypothetical protein